MILPRFVSVCVLVVGYLEIRPKPVFFIGYLISRSTAEVMRLLQDARPAMSCT